MGWKETLSEMKDQQDKMNHMLYLIQAQASLNTKRLIELKASIDSHAKGQGRAADRMADRMIEMAMVNRGSTREAASHRRTLTETQPEGSDLWQDSPNNQWPPPGCDAVNLP